MAILTIGFNPAVDRILECPGFHIGGHQQATETARLAAGKAANVNRALAQLGTDSVATGFVGVKEAKFFEDQLMAAKPGKVRCQFIEVAGKTRENITILDTTRNQETHIRDRGFAVSSEQGLLLEQKILKAIKAGDVAVFSGSLCEGLGEAYFDALLDKCIAAGAKVVVDSSGEPLKWASTRKLWLLKPNLLELRQLLGVEVPNAASALRDAAAPLLSMMQFVLVTRGPLGAVLLSKEKGAFSARVNLKETPIRTVGCGDHLLAGFLSEMVVGKGVEESLAKALAVATARALSSSMESFDPAIVKDALNSIEVEKI